MKQLNSTQEVVNIIDNQGAILFTRLDEPCNRCEAVKTVLSDTEIPFFELSAGMYPAKEFGIKTVPTFMVFKDGIALTRITGMNSKEVYLQALDLGEFTPEQLDGFEHDLNGKPL